jgi:hypothetical protein
VLLLMNMVTTTAVATLTMTMMLCTLVVPAKCRRDYDLLYQTQFRASDAHHAGPAARRIMMMMMMMMMTVTTTKKIMVVMLTIVYTLVVPAKCRRDYDLLYQTANNLRAHLMLTMRGLPPDGS